MKIIVCGVGQVGWPIARHLSLEGNDVTVIDSNPDLVALATEALDVRGVTGFASHPKTLERAGAKNTEILIAATHSDEVNMVACQVAHSIFTITTKVARLRSQAYTDGTYSELFRRDHIPIDVIINPEHEVADAALKRLYSPATFERGDFLGGEVQVLGITLDEDCPMIHTPLRQLSELFSGLCAFIVGIRRDGVLQVTDPDDRLFSGDQIYIIVRTDHENRTLELFGKTQKKPENLIIIGGGKVGLEIAQTLEKRPDRLPTKIIELDRKRAEIIADQVTRTIVLNGDGLSNDLLSEANAENASTVLCVTDNDQTNLLSAVRAKIAGCARAICVVNDPTLLPLLEPMKIDAFINPRASTVSSILKHIRIGRISAVYTIGDSDAEFIETEVQLSSTISGQKISDLDLPETVRIGAIKKGDEVLRPSGSTRIEAGDHLVMFVLAEDVSAMQRLLQVSGDFF